jgi:hypothetical protein
VARDFFELAQLGGGQLFLALLSAAGGLVLASVVWRLPVIERLEEETAEGPADEEETEPRRPPPTHIPQTHPDG